MSQPDNPSSDEIKVVVQSPSTDAPTARRLLDLNNVQTPELQILSPTAKEINALKINAKQALDDYASRLREGYKTNKDNFRDGLRLLSDSLDKGEQISVVCACRNARRICHADLVKMAVEKVNAYLKNERINEKIRNDKTESRVSGQHNSIKPQSIINPRTQRAINEILAFSENDRVLEKINKTDGRNRSEQASYLGRVSQFNRDIYERGGNIVDGNLIVPQEKLTLPESPVITTQNYAVEKLSKILRDEERAKNLAPVVVEYGSKIAGATADGETKLKIFGWMYDSLEGKSENSNRDENKSFGETTHFDETLEKISVLAEEMHSLEPLDKIEFVPLARNEQNDGRESVFDEKSENLNLEEIYEEAISRQEAETTEQSLDLEPGGNIETQGYERIELGVEVPRIPEDFTQTEITRFITEILPEIDRQIESGTSPKEILAPYNETVWQSAKTDAQNRLESIYREQKSGGHGARQSAGLSPDSHQNLVEQLAKIDLRRQNIIELKNPGEYPSAEKEAINTFFRRQKVEIGNLLTKIDDVREDTSKGDEKTQKIALKKEFNQIKEAKPNFAFKLENSAQIVAGKASEQSVQRRNFISSYINYQLKQPETRLRFENERYRIYANRLESAATREDVMKSASEIRAENAALGLKWKDLETSEKAKEPPPLTSKEMQFLFTESSPVHYTNEMTATRLSYAHTGASRRQITESLLKGETSPSPEAGKLIESLEERLGRSDLSDALRATRHFYLSLKTPNENLKIKNSFCHRETYQKLSPPEKDFVYQRAIRQLGNLEYRSDFRHGQQQQQQISARFQSSKETHGANLPEKPASKTEKSFRLLSTFSQARILGGKIDFGELKTKEISRGEAAAIALLLNNQSIEKNLSVSRELAESKISGHQKIGEILGVFSGATHEGRDGNEATVKITLPEKGLVSADTYAELLEKIYPENERDRFKLSRFGDERVAEARIKGEQEVLKSWSEEIKTREYQPEASKFVSSAKSELTENYSRLETLLSESGKAQRENNRALSRFIGEAGAEIQKQNRALPTLKEQKQIVLKALNSSGTAGYAANNSNNRFFQAVQKKITLGDFQKFAANEKLIGDHGAKVSQIFSQIEAGRAVVGENKIKNFEPKIEHKLEVVQHPDQKSENKPLSLRLYEAEHERAEKRLLTKSLGEKLALNNQLLQSEKPLNVETAFLPAEREQIKREAGQIAKQRLEPKELDADHRKIPKEASRQAISTFKQLEQAHNLYQFSHDSAKISEAFFKLDREALRLNQMRQDYTRTEKLALLREGVKSDLIDLLRKNPAVKTETFIGATSRILAANLRNTDLRLTIAGDGQKLNVLSREVGEKIEAKLKTFALTNNPPARSETKNNLIQTPNKSLAKDFAPPSERVKDAHLFTR